MKYSEKLDSLNRHKNGCLAAMESMYEAERLGVADRVEYFQTKSDEHYAEFERILEELKAA